MCLVRISGMFSEEGKGEKLYSEYIRPAKAGKLTLETLRNLNIEFEPGALHCVEATEDKAPD